MSSFRKFYTAAMTWLTVSDNLCRKWPRLCSVFLNRNPVISSFMGNHRVLKGGTRCVPLVAQKMLSLPAQISSPQVLKLFLLLNIFPAILFSFDHCIVYITFPSSIDDFWFPFDIFKLFLLDVTLYDAVSQCARYNIMWPSLSVTCDRRWVSRVFRFSPQIKLTTTI